MATKVFEVRPFDKNVFRKINARFDKGAKNASNMKDVFKTLVPLIKDAQRYAFSEANPTGWRRLSQNYVKWKLDNGYPSTIGIRTGALKKAVTDRALIKTGKRVLTYRLNPSVKAVLRHTKTPRVERVRDYAHYFDNVRPVFDYARDYINDFLKKTTAEYIRRGFK